LQKVRLRMLAHMYTCMPCLSETCF
jgi:hypothetical protein